MSLPTISAITDSQGVKYDLKDGQARADILDLSSSLSTISTVSLISDDIVYSKDLSVQRLTNEEYNNRVIDGKVNLSTLYIIADDHASFRGQQIKDVAEPTDDNDAATKKYVDDAVSEIDVSELDLLIAKNATNIAKNANNIVSLVTKQIDADISAVAFNQRITTIEEDTAEIQTELAGKIDKVAGKGLSQNDFTNSYLQKVNNAATIQYVDSKIGDIATILDQINGEIA